MRILEYIQLLLYFEAFKSDSSKEKSKPIKQIESKTNQSSNDIIEYFHQLSEDEQVTAYLSISAIQEMKRKEKYTKTFEFLIKQCSGNPVNIRHEHNDLIIQWPKLELAFKVPGNRLIFEHVNFSNQNHSFFEVDKDYRKVLQNIIKKYYFIDR